jgi:UPF0716 family protein affecting phage T7 exclusion
MLACSLLVYFDVVELGWRYLYLLGVATALIGIVIRRDTSHSRAAGRDQKNIASGESAGALFIKKALSS